MIFLNSNTNFFKQLIKAVGAPSGAGDGGGGPTADMLEALPRLAATGPGCELLLGNPRDFFQGLEAEARDLLTW